MAERLKPDVLILDLMMPGLSGLEVLRIANWHANISKFPFDTVKIDQSFVEEMENEPKAAAIIDTIMALGRTLEITITAEGVETPPQARIRREAGGRPLTAASADALTNAAWEEPDTTHGLRLPRPRTNEHSVCTRQRSNGVRRAPSGADDFGGIPILLIRRELTLTAV